MSANLYSQAFFATQKTASLLAAETIVPIVLELIPVDSVVDIGCGVGTWASAFAQAGISRVMGIDGPYVDRSQLMIPAESFLPLDLDAVSGTTDVGSFDLALSLEVAEHIHPDHAASFVEFLTSVAPVIVFSAAIPGQGGTGHLNEQWPSYWIELFDRQDYRVYDIVRPRIWGDEKIAYWYRQNILVFSRRALESRGRWSTFAPASYDLVHPEMFLKKSSLLHTTLAKLHASEKKPMVTNAE